MPESATTEPPPTNDAAARARVAALLDRLARVNLNVVVVGPPDAERAVDFIGGGDERRDDS